MRDYEVIPHFMASELRCKGSGELRLDEGFLKALHLFRTLLGEPIKVISCYRSVQHNKAVGGAADSFHLRGQAIDFAWPVSVPPLQWMGWAHTAGFRGVGLYRNFVHLDVGPPRHWLG